MSEQTTHLDVRFEHSDAMNEIVPALIKARQAMTNPKKTSEGHGYKYAELGDVLDGAMPALLEAGVYASHWTEAVSDTHYLILLLAHESGQYMRGAVELSAANKRAGSDDQAMGSSITYMRRYTLTAALGLAQADDDGAGGGSTPAKRPPAKASRRGRQPKQQGISAEEVKAIDKPFSNKPAVYDRDTVVANIMRGEEYVGETPVGREWLDKVNRPSLQEGVIDELVGYLDALTIMAKDLQSEQRLST